MVNNMTQSPQLPQLLASPLKIIPAFVHSTALVTFLNRIFAAALRSGDLEFLSQQVLLIRVIDARLDFRLTLSGNRLIICPPHQPYDLLIEGVAYDFLLLASHREDADTLFFNRRLRLEGNTELGLYLKNFLDAQEPETLFGPLVKPLGTITHLMERVEKIQAVVRFNRG